MAKRQDRLEACAGKLRLPTLLVRGALSDVLSEEGAQEFCELCPHAEYVNVTRASHMVAGDRNDIFGNAVIEFLLRVVAPTFAPRQPPQALHPHRERLPGDIKDIP